LKTWLKWRFASRDLVVCLGGEVGESTVIGDKGVELFAM
jgi:hypothetical protein